MAITDSFSGASLGTGWFRTTGLVDMIVSGGKAQRNSTFEPVIMRRTEYAFPDNQYAQAKVTFTTGANAAGARVCVRMDTSGNGYIALLALNNISLYKITADIGNTRTVTYIADTTVTAAASTEYTVKLDANGTTIKVYFEGSEVISTTDSTHTSGKPGIMVDGNTDQPTIDDFECTDATTIAPSHPYIVGAGRMGVGTGNVTPNLPTQAADDYWLLLIESANEAASLGTANGFTEITNSPQGTGTAGTTGATRLTIYENRCSGSNSAPVITDPGDHCVSRIVAVRGCKTSGSAINVTAGDVASSSSTSVTIPGGTTTVDNCLVLACVASGNDTNNPQLSSWANSSLTSLREEIDSYNTSGGGGGFAIASGVLATAGAYSATTATLAGTSVQGRISLALEPPAIATESYPAGHGESLLFSYNPIIRM